MKISAWTISDGDWQRPRASEYDQEIKAIRRQQRKSVLQVTAIFLLSATLILAALLSFLSIV